MDSKLKMTRSIRLLNKGPLEVHDEMKKQTNQNRIEIKTLEDEDLEEMNDWEIEVDEEDILQEAHNQITEVKYEDDDAIICKFQSQ